MTARPLLRPVPRRVPTENDITQHATELRRERIRGCRERTHHTGGMAVVRYGNAIADDADLRLCGDVAGKRVVELGISDPSNAVVLAAAGARALAVDPSPERISRLRREAEAAEVTVQCHQAEIADLGVVASASIDLVVAANSLDDVDDLARLLRQVHRVLKSDATFIMAGAHPIAAMLAEVGGQQVVQHAYGSGTVRSIGDWFMAMQRTNFGIDVMHELRATDVPNAATPAALVLRARKLGV